MTSAPTPISTILIANRGEIACRVIRTAKALGIKTIAVYSDADKNAAHVKAADDAVLIGPAPVAESYLKIERILAAATAKGADAIHPGYGFLSENAQFASACADAGIVFIGPGAPAIDLMGDKAKAKRRMIEAGVPCVPGYQGEDQSDETLLREGADIGFPIMVKAAAGGGGRGMRLVEKEEDLQSALETARSEAQNAFGSGELILEKAIISPRHIEIQVLADQHGAVVHLGERDCSVQRRHQKVIEEAPAPGMSDALRATMGEAAVKAARDIDYVGAGTVEFLLDASGEFYFLEMNTRLQVEHPVTEMITGLDLVAHQIAIAEGKSLGFDQDDVRLSGHAIEARLYAEDVAQSFLPAAGPVDDWRPPSGVRTDAGLNSVDVISPFYDPMVAKVIAHGASRDDTRRKLISALKDTVLFGTSTNKQFLIDVLERPAFAAGDATTAFIAENFSDAELAALAPSIEDALAAAVVLHRLGQSEAIAKTVSNVPALTGWSSATKLATPYRIAAGETVHDLTISLDGGASYIATAGERSFEAEIQEFTENSAVITIDGSRKQLHFNRPLSDETRARLQISVDGRAFEIINQNALFASAAETSGAGSVTAPMHGLLLEIFVKEGDDVAKGDRLAILEAMKMQHELVADADGSIAAIHAEAGAQVEADFLLMEIDIADD